MSLSTKTVLILLLAAVLCAGATAGIQRWLVFPTIVELEEREARGDMSRVVEALAHEAEHLLRSSADWASRDDTYRFMEERAPAALGAVLGPRVASDDTLDFVSLYAVDGTKVWGTPRTPGAASGVRLEGGGDAGLPEAHPLIDHSRGRGPLGARFVAGIALTDRGPAAVVSRPILTTDREGPSRGALIVGRLLTDAVVARIAKRTHVTFALWPVGAEGLPEDVETALARMGRRGGVATSILDDHTLRVYTTLRGVDGRPALALRALVGRGISAHARSAMWYATSTSVVAGLGLLVLLLVLLGGNIVRPLMELTARVRQVGLTGGRVAVSRSPRRDEIGVLAVEFDRMVDRLDAARKRLLEWSYHAGRAETAADVLHNVRNVLNVLSVGIDELRSDGHRIPLERIRLARAELVEGRGDPERREALERFVEMGTARVEEHAAGLEGRLEELAGTVAQLEALLATKDVISRQMRFMESVTASELAQHAANLMPPKLREAVDVRIHPSLQVVGDLNVHRIQLLHVLANLVVNAAESVTQAGVAEGFVEVSGGREARDGREMAHLRVRDNGGGIARENLSRVFERHFSTKAPGSRGLGLHWCANTVNAMGGSLYAEEREAGQGACFHLFFPVDAETLDGPVDGERATA